MKEKFKKTGPVITGGISGPLAVAGQAIAADLINPSSGVSAAKGSFVYGMYRLVIITRWICFVACIACLMYVGVQYMTSEGRGFDEERKLIKCAIGLFLVTTAVSLLGLYIKNFAMV